MYLVPVFLIILGWIIVYSMMKNPGLKKPVILKDGKSAVLGHNPLTLTDQKGRKIWIKTVKTEVLVDTVQDLIPVSIGNRSTISVLETSLRFTKNGDQTIVHWNEDLTPV